MKLSSPSLVLYTAEGRRGSIAAPALPWEPGSRVRVRFESGECLHVPVNFLKARADGGFLLPVALDEALRLWQDHPEFQTLIPVVAERPALHRRTAETGRVRITTRAATHDEDIGEPLVEETVEVERVPVNRPVNQPVSARYEGDTLVVPVFEEHLVVEKRLMLKEELRITKRRAERHRPRRPTLRQEEVLVERLPAHPPEGEGPGTVR